MIVRSTYRKRKGFSLPVALWLAATILMATSLVAVGFYFGLSSAQDDSERQWREDSSAYRQKVLNETEWKMFGCPVEDVISR